MRRPSPRSRLLRRAFLEPTPAGLVRGYRPQRSSSGRPAGSRAHLPSAPTRGRCPRRSRAGSWDQARERLNLHVNLRFAGLVQQDAIQRPSGENLADPSLNFDRAIARFAAGRHWLDQRVVVGLGALLIEREELPVRRERDRVLLDPIRIEPLRRSTAIGIHPPHGHPATNPGSVSEPLAIGRPDGIVTHAVGADLAQDGPGQNRRSENRGLGPSIPRPSTSRRVRGAGTKDEAGLRGSVSVLPERSTQTSVRLPPSTPPGT